MLKKTWWLLTIVAVVVFGWSALGQSPLPEGPGRDLVLRHCVACHDIGLVTRERLSRENWDRIISEMERYGMRVTPPERSQILSYLATHFAPAAATAPPAAPPPTAAAPVDGRAVFNNCVGCHQPTGAGIAGRFPPLARHVPDILGARGGREWIIQAVLYGLQGPITVRGVRYNAVMPGFAHLSNAELAAVLNFISTQWGNAFPARQAAFTAAEVEAQRARVMTPAQVHTARQRLGLR
jgi:mono/diheme cytochrome c family protein